MRWLSTSAKQASDVLTRRSSRTASVAACRGLSMDSDPDGTWTPLPTTGADVKTSRHTATGTRPFCVLGTNVDTVRNGTPSERLTVQFDAK